MWIVSPGVHWIAVDECIVVFDPSLNGFVELDESGAELWRVLNSSGWAEQAAIDHLGVSYDMDVAKADVMVSRFVHDLHANGMLSRAHG